MTSTTSSSSAHERTSLPRPLLTAFEHHYPGQTPDVFVRAPGRVNLLGGHVDMHEGTVINIAINRGVWLAAAYGPAADLVQVHAPDLDTSSTFTLNRLDEKTDIIGNPLPRWALYPAGIAWAAQRQGLKVAGVNAVFLSNVAMRAGLSSSAAVEVAFAIMWQSLAGWRLDRRELAQIGMAVERDYMGLGIGIQDEYTCLHARKDHVLHLDCRSLEHRHAALPDGTAILICDTQTRREIATSGYNSRADDAHATARTVRLVHKEVQTLRDVQLDRLMTFKGAVTGPQFQRARHVVNEIARVERGMQLLEAGDAAGFGELMNESYRSARDDYGSSSPELDAMWQAAAAHPACYGARYSGGGEAGAVVALVDANDIDTFISTTSAHYSKRSGLEGHLFAVKPAAGAGVFI